MHSSAFLLTLLMHEVESSEKVASWGLRLWKGLHYTTGVIIEWTHAYHVKVSLCEEVALLRTQIRQPLLGISSILNINNSSSSIVRYQFVFRKQVTVDLKSEMPNYWVVIG